MVSVPQAIAARSSAAKRGLFEHGNRLGNADTADIGASLYSTHSYHMPCNSS
jgi:hypothetical protein